MTDRSSYAPPPSRAQVSAVTLSSDVVLETLRGRSTLSTQDTIAAAAAKHKEISIGTPTLPVAAPRTPDFLDELIKGFCKIYSAMGHSTNSQTEELAQEQTLNLQLSEAVVDNTASNVEKQQNEITTQQQLQAQAAQDDATNSTINEWMLGITIALTVVSLGSALIDAIPVAAEEVTEIEMDEIPSEVDEGTEVNSDTESVNSTEPTSTESPAETEENVSNKTSERTQNTTSEETSKEVTKGKTAWQKLANALKSKWFQRIAGVTATAAFSSSQVYTGYTKIELSGSQAQLAQMQQDMGASMAVLQENNIYFRWSQQQMQRQGSVVQELTDQLSDVVQIASDTINTYRQISYGLASAA